MRTTPSTPQKSKQEFQARNVIPYFTYLPDLGARVAKVMKVIVAGLGVTTGQDGH